jgi:hypothetical protein
MIRRRSAIRVAVRGDEHVAGMDRPALGLHDEPTVGLPADRPDARPLVQLGARLLGQADEAGEPLAGMEQAARVDREAAVVRRRSDLIREPVARDHARRDAPRSADVGLGLELLGVRAGRGELHVAVEPQLGLDPGVEDRPFEELGRFDRVAVQLHGELRAVALDQGARAPLVARVRDAAVAGRGTPAERPRLEDDDRRATGRQRTGRGEARVATANDHRVDAVGEVAARPVRQGGHGRVPVRPALVVAVQDSVGRGWHPRKGIGPEWARTRRRP